MKDWRRCVRRRQSIVAHAPSDRSRPLPMENLVKYKLLYAASALALASLSAPAAAQHAGHGGMTMPMPAKPTAKKPVKKKTAPKKAVAKKPAAKKAPASNAAKARQPAKSEPMPMDHSQMDHSAMDAKGAKAAPKMDCCKDGCACCAKDKAKPTS